jgi:hypothetical protein
LHHTIYKAIKTFFNLTSDEVFYILNYSGKSVSRGVVGNWEKADRKISEKNRSFLIETFSLYENLFEEEKLEDHFFEKREFAFLWIEKKIGNVDVEPLKVGDEFVFSILTAYDKFSKLYFYLVHIDPNGEETMLYPCMTCGENIARQGEKVKIPRREDGGFLQVNSDNLGVEKAILFLSQFKLDTTGIVAGKISNSKGVHFPALKKERSVIEYLERKAEDRKNEIGADEMFFKRLEIEFETVQKDL